jgi:DNA-directed RNA polymerase specialized sigma24 family protein
MSLEKETPPHLELITRVRAGDPEQTKILYESFIQTFKYRVELHIRLNRRRDYALETMDYLHNAFCWLIAALRFGNQQPEDLWAFAGGIVRNCLRVRRNLIFLPLPSYHANVIPFQLRQAPGQLVALESKERDQQFAAAFAQLRECDQDILSRVYFQGQEYESIRQDLGLKSIDAIYQRVSRATRRFAALIQEMQTPEKPKIIEMRTPRRVSLIPESLAA